MAGRTIDDSVELAKKLKENGADVIDCSSGFGSTDYKRYPFGPGWQVPFSERIKREVNIATAAVGLITDPGRQKRYSQMDEQTWSCWHVRCFGTLPGRTRLQWRSMPRKNYPGPRHTHTGFEVTVLRNQRYYGGDNHDDNDA